MYDQPWMEVTVPVILVGVFVILLVCTGAIVLDAKRSEIVTAAAWRISPVALAVSAVGTAVLYGTPLPIALCTISVLLALVVLRYPPTRPPNSVPRYNGSRAMPPTDPWAT